MSEPMALFDVVIVGGGPAGCAAGCLLARLGHRVALVTRAPAGEPALAESVPPSCQKLLDVIGLREAVEAARFIRATGNTVWWGSEHPRVETFPDGATGYQVDRATFDERLLDAARAAGVAVRTRVDVRAVDWRDGIAEVRMRALDGGPSGLAGRYVLDCSGRRGVLARRGLRQIEPGVRTLALLADWLRPDGWPIPDPTHTLVESYADGWAWSVPRSRERRIVACMVDGRPLGPRRQQLAARYAAELAKTRAFARLLEGAQQVGPVWACDASLYAARRFAGPGFLLVGDAGSFLDPLSSYGIKKALASAWLAAVVVHTCLVRPAMEGAALEYFTARERQVYRACRAQSARYFREAGSVHSHPFWTARGELPERAPWDEEPDVEVVLLEDPAVPAVFEQMRRSPAVWLQPTAAVRVDLGPAVVGHEIALVPRLVGPAVPGGLRYLRGIDVPRVVELARHVHTVPALFEAYAREATPADLAEFLRVLAVLVAKGWLENVAAHTPAPGMMEGAEPARS